MLSLLSGAGRLIARISALRDVGSRESRNYLQQNNERPWPLILEKTQQQPITGIN